MDLLKYVESQHTRSDIPELRTGQTVRVHTRIIEGSKERVQVFEGTVLRVAGEGVKKSFTVRKLSHGVGVERIFPIHSPRIQRVEVMHQGYVRQSRIYYLRDRIGKKAKLRKIDSI
ncbi:MAG TPA: 50S ribosomal protein L19 [Myxococcales bacterium]|nr:50S ribosomal protein L19 [Myxococcales bacterium]HAN32652.1 50S ribosomal protein L19 [Myxococcales bacterium]